jgi:hypothetical protein
MPTALAAPVATLQTTIEARWFALVAAEARGASDATLQRLFHDYMAALDALAAAQRQRSRR